MPLRDIQCEDDGRDVFHYLCGEEACRQTLEKLLVPPVSVSDGVSDMRKECGEFLKLLTWNIAGKEVSAQAPGEGRWSLKDNLAAVEAEVLRWDADVIALQECPSSCGLQRLVPQEGAVFDLVGVAKSHCGYVHVYARKSLLWWQQLRGNEGHG